MKDDTDISDGRFKRVSVQHITITELNPLGCQKAGVAVPAHERLNVL
jgi:hypothetical protein